MMKQYQGEYMGSILSAWLESMGRYVRVDRDDYNLDERLFNDGFGNAVRGNDEQYPPDFRLSKSGRKASRKEDSK
jgi:hypothetical protein